MSTKLDGESTLIREISVPGVGPVLAEFSGAGIRFRVKGSRKAVRTPWLKAIEAGYTGEDVPSFLAGRPVELLRHQGRNKEQ